MFKKRIIMVFLLLAVLGCMASVSASDLNDNVIGNASDDELAIYAPLSDMSEGENYYNSNTGMLSAQENNQDNPLEAAKDTGKGTFTELQTKVNKAGKGSTIYLDKDYYYNNNFGSKNGIKITKPITIDGKGHTIDGLEKSALLLIFKTSNVVLKNIVFRNGNVEENDGAVCVFQSNYVKFNKCQFDDNFAYNGGAVLLAYSNHSSFASCKFNTNFAIYDGGALYLDHSSSSFKSCNFKHNDADYGSVLYSYQSSTSFDSCRFDENCALYSGGLYLDHSSSSFDSCRFNSNIAGYGGAVFLDNCKGSSFRKCRFFDNYADYGGAVYLDNCIASSFKECIFDENVAYQNAAVIYLEKSSSSFESCSFDNNYLSDYEDFSGDYIDEEFWSEGGAIFSSGSILNILNSDFNYNCAGMSGGDIYSRYGMVYLENSSFYGSYAYGFGGSLSFNNDYVQINKCSFDDCMAVYHGGGAVYCLNSVLYSYSTNYIDCFSYFGGAICSINTELDIQKNEFDSNRAGSVGGSIYTIYGSLNLCESVFSYSYAVDGGAMYISSPHRIYNIADNLFLYCSAKIASRIYIDGYYGEIPESNNIYEEIYFVYSDFAAQLNETSQYNCTSNLLTYVISNSNQHQNELPFYRDLTTECLSKIGYNNSNIGFVISDKDKKLDSILFLNYDDYNSSRLVYDVDNYYSDFYNSTTALETYIYNFNGDLLENLRITSHVNFSAIGGIDPNFSYIAYYSGMSNKKAYSLYPISDDEKNITVFDKFAGSPYFWICQIEPDEFYRYKINGILSFNFKDCRLCYNYGNILESNMYAYAVSIFNPKYYEEDSPIYYDYYDSRDYGYITPVKDQGIGSNCWAFAGIATLEACLKKLTNRDYDLSVNNAKNLMAASSIYGLNLDSNFGGYDSMFMSYLTSWLGPIGDEYDEYNPASYLSIKFWSIFHIQNIAFLSPRTDSWDNDEIKQAIMDCGAVAVTINWTDDDGYRGLHSICLVGWNDEYEDIDSLGNYARGAWIFKNSWGEDWGDDGFGYLSYNQKLSGEVAPYLHAYTFVFSDGDVGYQDIYQYDFAGFTDYLCSDADFVYYKNKFVARDDEFLYAFSTYFEKPTYFTYSVRINGNDITEDENNNTIVNSIHYSPAGYHTIPLGYNLTLKYGDEFEIVIKLINSGENYIPVCQAEELYRLSYPSNVSFISYNGRDWFDLYDLKSNNKFAYSGNKANTSQVACIKAFTTLWSEDTLEWASEKSDDKILDGKHYDIFKLEGNFSSNGEKILSYFCSCLQEYDNRDDYIELNVNDGSEIYYLKIDNGTAYLNIDDWQEGHYKCLAQLKSNFFTSNPVTLDFILADELYGPFSELAEIINNASDGDVITLDKNYCFDSDFNDSIVINKSLIIDGKDHILSGRLKSGIFKILSDCNVTLKNMEFRNGKSRDGSGAIFSNGTLNIYNCIFSANTADFGGAICSIGECFIANSLFFDNSAGYYGSCIYSRNILNVTYSYFKSRENKEFIYFTPDTNGNLYLKTNKMYLANSNAAAIIYDNYDKSCGLPLHLLFMNGSAIRGDYVNLCQIVDDEGNRFRIGDINVTLTNQNININRKIGYNLALGGYVFDTSVLDYGTYSLSGNVSDKCSVKDGMLHVVKKSLLTSSGLTKVYGKNNKLKVTLKDDEGKAISDSYIYVKLNGKTYEIKTYSNGMAKLTVNLVPKTYTATISFEGNKEYFSSSINVKIIIKKAKPKLTASKKTYKLKTKTKKYTVTLKNNLGKVMKNKKVSLKVKGKTYSVKTDSKGKAIFKLKLTKKGKFTAVIKYKGDKYYKSVSKKVKITVNN